LIPIFDNYYGIALLEVTGLMARFGLEDVVKVVYDLPVQQKLAASRLEGEFSRLACVFAVRADQIVKNEEFCFA
jgi:hypothetical protein